ncbi:MAG: hypothetical protein A2934_03825 [Candidatus Sungbacteria bacterium RIFCSPLOWO2_01_FULL_47_10]|uniref:Phosphoglycerate mutase n=1 Tax=Candidatus Sungbacteria bacterium RIFCSPLOWO2_01_FULL_47_10 TaxID=1802276 RepID=A0A1G2L7I7_9BACT|nr:MAG: hypothetical protein A2934_03825 [Candidatus Sungbacteria bacterium RIFCSPLOWO2_01_FULL_47_10]
MKKVYFVRHGESEGNVGPVRQTPASRLTDRGRRQAVGIAERAMRLPIEIIISSSMNRAQETARIISEKTGMRIESSDLLVERRRPSEQVGKPKDDPTALESERLIKENFSKPGYRYSDEENFDDLKIRALNALDFLSKRPEGHICAVTHGVFMRVVVACVVFGRDLNSRECAQFMHSFRMENTGITVFGYDEEKMHPWWVWVWNDHAHLAELENEPMP